MKRPFIPLPQELADKFKVDYRKALLSQKDTRGNQILTEEQADWLMLKFTDRDIKSLYDDEEKYDYVARYAVMKYREVYPEDIENFRNCYREQIEVAAQPWQAETVKWLLDHFDERYTDAEIRSELRKGHDVLKCISLDLNAY